MKKLTAIIFFALAAQTFAKTTGFMLRPNGPLRTDKGHGGVEWGIQVPEGTMLEIESEEPIELTLITEKERIDKIKFYKVNYDRQTYYVRESEVALGGNLTVILSDTTIFRRPSLSSFANAQIERASVVVAGEKKISAGIEFREIQYWSQDNNEIRRRFVFAEKASENPKDLEAVRIADTAVALKNKNAEKERAMKLELFQNAKELSTSAEIAEFISEKYDDLFGEAESGRIFSDDGAKINVRKYPVDGDVSGQLEHGAKILIKRKSSEISEIDGIEDYWYYVRQDSPNDNTKGWVFGKYVRIGEEEIAENAENPENAEEQNIIEENPQEISE